MLLVALGAIAFLVKGADWLVEGAAGLARRLGLPKVIIDATIVSLGTTSPECAVSVMAAWRGNAGLALGNAVGSIIADTALIFGIGRLLARLPADRFQLRLPGSPADSEVLSRKVGPPPFTNRAVMQCREVLQLWLRPACPSGGRP